MVKLRYAGSEGSREYELGPGETVLDCLLRNQVPVSYSCRSGVCQSCLVKGSHGAIPPRAQEGVKDTLRAQGYFLACRCEPEGDLTVSQGADQRLPARITSLADLGANVLQLKLEPAAGFEFRAGQYISLFREDGLARSYSLASLPSEPELELHVRLIPGGAMSEWLRATAKPGTTVSIQGPSGNCFYLPGQPAEPLLLAGTGTGLAPLYGIARDALSQGHTGPVWLFHGALDPSGLYLQDELRALAAQYSNLQYVRSVLRNGAGESLLSGADIMTGALDESILQRIPNFTGWKAYLCGDPAIVNTLRRKVFMAGAASRAIYADAFLPSAPAPTPAAPGPSA